LGLKRLLVIAGRDHLHPPQTNQQDAEPAEHNKRHHAQGRIIFSQLIEN